MIDTNVLVSALLKAGSIPERALLAILDARMRPEGTTVLVDAAVLAEYAAVLDRPKFRMIDRGRIAELFATLRTRGATVEPHEAWSGDSLDESDRIFIALALAGRADAIVTGNIKDFPDNLGFEVLPPATLLARLES